MIDTAQRFPECTFVSVCLRIILCLSEFVKVGFDLVDIQVPLRVLDPSVARRIEWMQGNL